MNSTDRSFYKKSHNTEKEYKYTKRIIAFLDILGFKSIVQNPDFNMKFGIMFKMINEMNGLNLPQMHLKGMEFTSISDSIVISVPYKEKASLEKIVRTLFVLERLFIREELLLRGAIAIGDLYHKNGIVFGPALVEAYLLERDCAIYPRCIIKENTLLQGLETCKSDFGKQQTIMNFRKDFDGTYFYDYLRDEFKLQLFNDREFEEPWQVFEEMQEIKCLIEGYLKASYPDKVMMKYQWLKRYYNNVILEFNQNRKLDCKEFIIKERENLIESMRSDQNEH